MEPTTEEIDARAAELFGGRMATAPAMMRDAELAGFLSLGRSTLWRHVAAGLIPQPARLGGRSLFSVAEAARAVARLDLIAQREPRPMRGARGPRRAA
jgi:predicted DNA-binding transcriptional regulator AlpA